MFEVGKKYASNYGYNTTPSELVCIWVEGDQAVLRDLKKSWLLGVFSTDKNNFPGYTEIKEPIVVKSRRYVIFDGKAIITTASEEFFQGKGIIGTVEFIVTDGVLTNVEIIK